MLQGDIQVKTKPGGTVPQSAIKGDFASDLRINEDVLIYPGQLSATLISTGLSTAFNENQYGLIVSPRSSMSKLPLTMANSFGIIEGTYRGDIKIALRNTLHHDPQMFSPFAITLNDKKELEQVSLDDIPAGTLQRAKKQYIKEQEFLFDRELPKDMKEQLFVEGVPHGTVFLPQGYRIAQAFLTPKVDTTFTPTQELPPSERGTGGFGSTGVN